MSPAIYVPSSQAQKSQPSLPRWSLNLYKMSPSQAWAGVEATSFVFPGAEGTGIQALAHRQNNITICNSAIVQWPIRD